MQQTGTEDHREVDILQRGHHTSESARGYQGGEKGVDSGDLQRSDETDETRVQVEASGQVRGERGVDLSMDGEDESGHPAPQFFL